MMLAIVIRAQKIRYRTASTMSASWLIPSDTILRFIFSPIVFDKKRREKIEEEKTYTGRRL